MTLEFRSELLTVNSVPGWMANDHFNEVGTHKGLTKRPDLDWKFYMDEQRAGRLLFVTARDENHDLVGYAGVLLKPHPHYKGVLVAHDDLHYLMPKWRGIGMGKTMMRCIEGLAMERGATLFILRTKAGVNDHGHIFEGMGYELTDLVYTKDLTNASPQS